MASESEIRAAARSLATTVVSGSSEVSPDAPRPGDGQPRWMNWERSARLALEAAERERYCADPDGEVMRKAVEDEFMADHKV